MRASTGMPDPRKSSFEVPAATQQAPSPEVQKLEGQARSSLLPCLLAIVKPRPSTSTRPLSRWRACARRWRTRGSER